jgi:multidrug efflux pump subunit AcrB
MAVLIAILGGVAIVTMPVDIFPYIDIPVVSVIWNYQGMSPDEIEKRIDTIFERSMTTTVNDIEHIETQAYSGVSVTRVYFQPAVKVEMAMAQVTAICQTLLRIFPQGTYPPNIVKYDASSVPILQLGLQSKTLSEQQIFDLGLNFIRTQLATVQGAAVPLPFGGKFRQVMVDLNPEALYAKQLSPVDVSNALGQQSLILPAGDIKIGDLDYQVKLNNSPIILDQLNDLPIRVVNGATVYLKDVAQVRDGYSVQTSIVRTNGTRGALLTVLRNGKASTLSIVEKVKEALPKILAGLQPEMELRQFFDK